MAAADVRHGTRSGYGKGCKCEPCLGANRANSAKWAAEHPEEVRARWARYRAANAEKRRAVSAQYRVENLEKVQARESQYRAENLEILRTRQVEFYAEHSESRRANSAKWRAENPDYLRSYGATYRVENPEKTRVGSANRRARKLAQWVESVDHTVVWGRDGGVCHICGLPADPDNWHLDHVVPLILGGEHSYRNTAVSHPVCNQAKGGRLLPSRERTSGDTDTGANPGA